MDVEDEDLIDDEITVDDYIPCDREGIDDMDFQITFDYPVPRVSSPSPSHLPTPGHATLTELGCGPSFSPCPLPDPIPDSTGLEGAPDSTAPEGAPDSARPVSASPDSAALESEAAGGPAPDLPRSFPSGPRTLDFLRGYETHIAKTIYKLTPVIAPALVIEPLLPPLPPSRRRRGQRGQLAGAAAAEVAPAAVEPLAAEHVVGGEALPGEMLPIAAAAARRLRGPGVGGGDLCRKVLHIHCRTSFTTPLERYITDDLDSWFYIAERSGLAHLRLMGTGAIDRCLISPFVERWHAETSSFHFPWGEITITLHYVLRILRLSIEGRSISTEMTDIDIRRRIADDFGVELPQIELGTRQAAYLQRRCLGGSRPG